MAASPATAHVLIPGLTGFPSLALHPFASVETLLVIVSLGLAVAAADRVPLRDASSAAAMAAMSGAILQPYVLAWPGLWRLPLLVALGLGCLAAAGALRPRAVALVAVLLAAGTIGLGVPPERAGMLGTLEAGAGAAAACCVAIVVAWLARNAAGSPLGRIAIRVAGAWIIAIVALGLAVTFR